MSIESRTEQITFSPGVIDVATRISSLDTALRGELINEATHAKHVLFLIGIKTKDYKLHMRAITLYEDNRRRG